MANSVFVVVGNDVQIRRSVTLHLAVHSERRLKIAKLRTTHTLRTDPSHVLELDAEFLRASSYLEILKHRSDRDILWFNMQQGYTEALLRSTITRILRRRHAILVAPMECAAALYGQFISTQVILVQAPGEPRILPPPNFASAMTYISPKFTFDWVENDRALLMQRLNALMEFVYSVPTSIHVDADAAR